MLGTRVAYTSNYVKNTKSKSTGSDLGAKKGVMEVNVMRRFIYGGHPTLETNENKQGRISTRIVAICMLSLTACGTMFGGAVGAGSGAAIGAGTGYGAKKGALIGGGAGAAAGAVYDILR